jgi:hypothetical protein
MSDSKLDRSEEVDKIYSESMAKLNELKTAHREILTAAMKRVDGEQIEKIKQNLLKNSQ